MQTLPEAIDAASAALADQNAATAREGLEAARSTLVGRLGAVWDCWQQSFPELDADLDRLRALMDPKCYATRGFGTGSLVAQRAYDLAAPALAKPDFEDIGAVAAALQAWRDFGASRKTASLQWANFMAAVGFPSRCHF